MKHPFLFPPAVVSLCAGLWLGFGSNLAAQTATNITVLFNTGFEASEGYDLNYTLVGQGGWVGYGTGGNGMVSNYFSSQGQQAFIGYAPPEGSNDALHVWRPIVFVPDSNRVALIQFTVDMSIVDSTNKYYDDFRWSVYNTNGYRLFTVDFDNYALLASYALDDDAGYISTGVKFTNNVVYKLLISMDLQRNSWSAKLDDVTLVTALPITTTNAALSLGDIDAVWSIRTPGSPGNNYMIFDDYRIAAVTPTPSPGPRLQAISRLPDGRFLLRVTGEPMRVYAIDATSNMTSWSSLKTNSTAADGTFDFLDTTAGTNHFRYYRAREAAF